MKIYDIPQGTDEWHQIRVGRITGSKFPLLLQKGRNSQWSAKAIDYAFQLASERLTRVNDELVFGNKYTDYGHQQEEVARGLLEAELLEPIQQVGFIDYKIGEIGCSPDGLTRNKLIEIKSFAGKHHAKILVNGVDDDQKYQTIFNTFVSGKEIGLLCYFNPYFPKEMKIFEFSKDDFTDEMMRRLLEFNGYVNKLVEKIKENL